MFKEERTQPMFKWNMIGDIDLGRPNMGPTTSVAVYRLMQFTLRDILIKEVGTERTDKIFFDAGKEAGTEFYKNILTQKESFEPFINDVQDQLKELRIGILRVEEADINNNAFMITVSEDLDCSGLPVCDEEVCTYDEGFISALFECQMGTEFRVKEIDCWCSGARVCRFKVEKAYL